MGFGLCIRKYKTRYWWFWASHNQFLEQEPGSATEIKNSCLIHYGVTFPVFSKIDVNGNGMRLRFILIWRQRRLSQVIPTKKTGCDARWHSSEEQSNLPGATVSLELHEVSDQSWWQQDPTFWFDGDSRADRTRNYQTAGKQIDVCLNGWNVMTHFAMQNCIVLKIWRLAVEMGFRLLQERDRRFLHRGTYALERWFSMNERTMGLGKGSVARNGGVSMEGFFKTRPDFVHGMVSELVNYRRHCYEESQSKQQPPWGKRWKPFWCGCRSWIFLSKEIKLHLGFGEIANRIILKPPRWELDKKTRQRAAVEVMILSRRAFEM